VRPLSLQLIPADAAYAVALAVCVLLTGCKKTPDEVLDKEEMASLMADIHLGEAVVDFNYSAFPNDSTRKALKQSIYAAHNVTAEDVDTSYAWYGNHIEDYIAVYDRTIEIIQDRQKEMARASNAQLTVAGDSVDVWRGPRPLQVRPGMPSRILTFSISPDSTWKNGDVYRLMYKPVNVSDNVQARLLVDYDDGTTSYVDEPMHRQNSSSLTLQVDSTHTPLRVYGYMTFTPDNSGSFEVDSIALTRIRKELVTSSFFPYRIFENGKKDPLDIRPDNGKDRKKSDSGLARHPDPRRTKHKSSATPPARPQSSAQSGRGSEHRDDAQSHKPTPKQRREANQRHTVNNQPVKRVPMNNPKQN